MGSPGRGDLNPGSGRGDTGGSGRGISRRELEAVLGVQGGDGGTVGSGGERLSPGVTWDIAGCHH